jgi:hypothetical protein
MGYEYHNLVFWAVKTACFPLLPFIESMALILCFFSEWGLGKTTSINYANDVRIIFTRND